MKPRRLIAALALLLFAHQPALSAPPPPIRLVESGGWDFAPPDDVAGEHDEIEDALWAEIQSNIERLYAEGKLTAPNAAQAVPLAWPLRAANGLADAGYHGVSAFVDHDPVIGQLLDYNNGQRTYDSGTYNHKGTDYFLWPFNWNKVDNNEVEVIAAAPATLIFKRDGYFDHNCSFNSEGFGNVISLQHADGSVTIYGHMKNGSLTSKPVGDPIAQGEYLGVVASSGNSTGPHLHFEVRTNATGGAPIMDPYTGPANSIPSLWAAQRPYYDSAINTIATADAYPAFPTTCGQHTDPHVQDHFSAPGEVQFHLYYRDYRGALPTLFYIYQPDNTIYYTWSHTETTPFVSAAFRYWVYDFPADAPLGRWRLEALFNGQTYSAEFYLLSERLYLPIVGG